MIIVKIERWSDDADLDDPREQQRAHTNIARAVMRNDHLGSDDLGNYDVELYDPPPYNPWSGETRRGRVESFPRKELGAWDLIYRALAQIVGERNDLDAGRDVGAGEPAGS
ncbi:MAG TPA: hypothetical protein VMD59_24465 [Acidimicrobiales bacterium]|nr:hypothetical protein [Acidimicrobiales bacterium]